MYFYPFKGNVLRFMLLSIFIHMYNILNPRNAFRQISTLIMVKSPYMVRQLVWHGSA